MGPVAHDSKNRLVYRTSFLMSKLLRHHTLSFWLPPTCPCLRAFGPKGVEAVVAAPRCHPSIASFRMASRCAVCSCMKRNAHLLAQEKSRFF
jgi:hypothetical protein